MSAEKTVLQEMKHFAAVQKAFTLPAVRWVTDFAIDVIREIITLIVGVSLGVAFMLTATGPHDNSVLTAILIAAILLALGYRAGEKLLEWLAGKWGAALGKLRKRSDYPDLDGDDDA